MLERTAGTGPAAMVGTLTLATTAYLAGAWRLRRVLALDAFTKLRRGKTSAR
jgi:hypothetical protein